MKKFIPEHKVQRMRNLVTKNFNDKTKIQIGYGKSEEEYKEGDIWEENGKKWTIKNGITQTVSKLAKVRQTVNMPLVCPKCQERVMRGYLDKLFWVLYSECSDCRIGYETKLKIKNMNKYKEYEREKIVANVKTYLKDIKMYAKDFIGSSNRKGYISETGKIEDWSIQNKEDLTKKIHERIEKIEEDLTKNQESLNKDIS
jgi:hypothetical protein